VKRREEENVVKGEPGRDEFEYVSVFSTYDKRLMGFSIQYFPGASGWFLSEKLTSISNAIQYNLNRQSVNLGRNIIPSAFARYRDIYNIVCLPGYPASRWWRRASSLL
jgi:hypothetical protein